MKITFGCWEPNPYQHKAFMREGFSSVNYNLVIWEVPNKGWVMRWTPFLYISDYFKTPESLMFHIDLLLFEYCKDKKNHSIENLFIFPDYDL